MLISKKCLSQYIDLKELTIEELADKVTAAGLEVEGIEYLGKGTNLVIGEILNCNPHPDSDHLHVCAVNIGNETLQIVCGAPNCKTGLKVIVAKAGAVLPEIEIKKGVIRGVESNGMICSLLELGVDGKNLSDYQKAGIEELPKDAPIGETNVLGYLGLDDEILDIGLTPNRNDCLAAFSMAKEVGAVLDKKVNLPAYEGKADGGSPTKLVVASQTDKCPLYTGKIIRSLTIKESPMWIKHLLQASGVKSINNVVDISNLVMLETGQPLHFFDISKLEKEEIIVKDGLNTKYTALDGIEYTICEDDIMITINDKPVAIGGVMGGDDSKIDDNTKGILIEAASFNHVAIRNTARRLNLNSDSSIRYQKGIEPKAPYKAMDRAVQLLVEYADAMNIEETTYSTQREIKDITFDVSLKRMNKLMGTQFTNEQVINVLKRLDFNPTENGEMINVVVPSYRQDITIEADIAEEIIRIIGFDDLKSTMPVMGDTPGRLNKRQQLRRTLREVLTGQGFYEATSYTLVSEKTHNDAIMPFGSYVELVSPMSEDRKIIRGSILPSLLNCVAYNKARSSKNIAFFEISNVYAKDKVEERLSIVLHGNLQENRWQKYEIKPTFYTIKGYVEAILEKLGYTGSRIVIKENKLDTTHFHPYQSSEVYIGRDLLGIIGVIHPTMAKEYEVSECVMAELNLEVILNNKTSKVKFEPVSKYPQIVRDLAFVAEKDLEVSSVIKAIKGCGKQIIKDVEVFDVYMGEHVENGYKSIALSITFQVNDRTLKDEEINTVHDQILKALKDKLNVALRV